MNTREEGNANLLKLADYLDTIPARNFNYEKYASDACGTVACALGHACKLWPDHLRLTSSYPKYLCWTPVSCTGVAGFVAGNDLFCLTADEAEYLFLPLDDDEIFEDAKYVANKIRIFVERRENEITNQL